MRLSTGWPKKVNHYQMKPVNEIGFIRQIKL